MSGNKVIELIIEFIKAIQSEEKALIGYENGLVYRICSPRYLLGQILRQYELPWQQYYISENAEYLWNNVSSKNIWDYSYRQYVKCENDIPAVIQEFTGNASTPRKIREVKKGDGFIFRDVFHDEHMIPINKIIESLIALPEPDCDNIKRILDNIYICRLLKIEDRMLPVKYQRPFDLQKIISMYSSAGIKINKRR